MFALIFSLASRWYLDILFFENDHLNNKVAGHPEDEEDQQKDDFREYANLELELNWILVVKLNCWRKLWAWFIPQWRRLERQRETQEIPRVCSWRKQPLDNHVVMTYIETFMRLKLLTVITNWKGQPLKLSYHQDIEATKHKAKYVGGRVTLNVVYLFLFKK